MSLPPGFLDELRNRVSLSQVVGRRVIWDQRKSNQAKGDMWAPCPFHQEKTASFHVDDRKGFYYCFGCHAKGDAISFIRETENAGFMEAVEILAREAGMEMPARDPKAQEKADRRSRLAEVMEQAVQHYRLQMKTAAAAQARDYLAGRGLSPEAIERWEIGFAPDARRGLFEHLVGKGVAEELIVEAGLAARPDDGGAPYDRFRGRIIFPIRDARGRAIALGGRAMDPNARAKYLNSPETPLFDKGRTLYNHGPARAAAGRGAALIVAEGYMDVIALSEAGFAGAVAPLGTAITESQLAMLWRIHPEPVIALDGDQAGLRAGWKLVDLALPMIEAGNTLRFALLPEGLDPDDLLRARGKSAMEDLIASAVPLVHMLWRRETEGKSFDTPERRAALDKRLRALLRQIRDPDLRRHYGEEIARLREQLFGRGRQSGGARRSGGGNRRPWKPGRGARFTPPPAPLRPDTRQSLLARGGEAVEDHLREAVILATLIVTPAVFGEFEAELERLEMRTPEHRALLAAILAHGGAEDLRARLEADLGAPALEKLFRPRHVQIAPPVRRPGDLDLARMCLAEELAKLAARRGAEREISEAAEDMAEVADEGLTWRLRQAAEAVSRAIRSGEGDESADFVIGPNGALLRREERDAFARLLEEIGHDRSRKTPE